MSGLNNVNQVIVEELKEKIALGCRILAKLGLSDYLGHVSARIPGTDLVLIKARGLDVGNLLDMTADKVVTVDLEASMVGTPRGMSREEAELQIKDALAPMANRWKYYCSLL